MKRLNDAMRTAVRALPLALLLVAVTVTTVSAQKLKKLKAGASIPEWISNPPEDLPDRVLIIGTGYGINEMQARAQAEKTAHQEITHLLNCPAMVIFRWFDDYAPLTEQQRDSMMAVFESLPAHSLAVTFENGIVQPELDDKGRTRQRVWLMGWLPKSALRQTLKEAFKASAFVKTHLEQAGKTEGFERFLETLDCF
jgi:hypothetical protein